ncbi:1765_t:CDS:2 [Cetraspora pellucida]|uniref:1765_t:CDS:1 n=1 Tax=Cetraspora pellucida TaxID=1433469 RepID=A0A9N9HC24_9GLOM|nr:1765_t:CDS:2 [Cetraspora pellucida]
MSYWELSRTRPGITPTTTKVAAVSNFPRPKNLRALRGFLGLAGFYRRFIKDFSGIATPLYKLLKTGENFTWKEQQQEAFVLYTDASHLALGAVLSQPGDNGLKGVVEYTSRSTKPAERNYTITELEWDIKSYIQSCDVCQRRGKPKTREALHPIQVPGGSNRVFDEMARGSSVT